MKWTKEMDKIIAKCILNHQRNHTLAFMQAQDEIINKFNILISRKAVSSRYYRNRDVIDSYVIDCALADAYKIPKEEAKKVPWYVKLWNTILSIFNKNRKP